LSHNVSALRSAVALLGDGWFHNIASVRRRSIHVREISFAIAMLLALRLAVVVTFCMATTPDAPIASTVIAINTSTTVEPRL
jgi:hypothetical protein